MSIAKELDKLKIAEYLRENLKVEVKHNWATPYCHATIEVSLSIGDEVISTSEATVYD